MKALTPLLPIPILMAVYSVACVDPEHGDRAKLMSWHEMDLRYGLCAFCAGVICLLIVWCIARGVSEE